MTLLESTRNLTTFNESRNGWKELRSERADPHAQERIRNCAIPGLKEKISHAARVNGGAAAVTLRGWPEAGL